MGKYSAELKVGFITLLSLVILGLGTLFVGKFQLFQKTYQMDVYFDFVSGLQEGAPVRLNGVKVGAVQRITIQTDKTPPIVVTLQLTKDARLHKDARAFINTMGLMGEKYVEVYAGSADQGFLALGESIKGQSPAELQEILTSSKSVADDLARTMSVLADIFTQESTKRSLIGIISQLDSITLNIDETIKGRRGDIESFAKNLRIISENMNKTIDGINALVAENRSDTRTTIANITQISTDLKNHSKSIMENLDKLSSQLEATTSESRPDLKTTLANFKDASEDFKKTMKRLDNIAAGVEKGEGSVGKILKDETLYGQTTETMNAVRQVAVSVASSGKIFSGTQFEYELRYRDSMERMRNDIHLRITPNDNKYYIIGASDIGKDVGLDLLYTRKIKDFDVKLGILESEAAAGIDYNLIKDKWKIGITGIGLTEKQPRLDAQTEIKIGKYFDVDWYGIVGGENLTRDATANAGIQLRY